MGERRGSEIDRRDRRCERERERESSYLLSLQVDHVEAAVVGAHREAGAARGPRQAVHPVLGDVDLHQELPKLPLHASTLEMLAAKILHLKSLEPVARSQLLECQLTHVTDEVCFFLMIFEIHQLFSSW